MRVRLVSIALILAFAARADVAVAQVAPPAPSPVAAADYLPDDVVAAVGIRDADRHAASFRRLLERVSFYESASYRAFFRNAKVFAARVALAGLAATADTDEWGAVGMALGRDLALGVRITPRPEVLLVTVPRDPAGAAALLRSVRIVAKSKEIETVARGGAAGGDPIAIHAVGRGLFHAFCDDALLVSNGVESIKAGIRARRTGRSFARGDAARAVRQAVPSDAALWAWADVATTRDAMQQAGRWPERLDHPLLAFVAGGWWRHLSSGDRAIAWSVAADQRFALEVRIDGASALPESHRGFLSRGIPLGWAAEALPRYVADFAITRDWAALFAEREQLLDLAGVGDLSKFLTGVGNFLGDLDVVEDVLPKVNGALRVIVAEQAFPKTFASGEPSPTLPAFALVAPLDDIGGRFARQLEKAAQIALNFVNYQAMQQKEATFLIETERYRDCRVLSTFYDEIPEQPTIRFNFQPAVAAVGGHYVIATSKALLRSIADSILGGTPRGDARPMTDTLSIDAAAVRRLLQKNREPLIVNTILAEDATRHQAAKKVDGLIGLLDFFRGVEWSARTESDGTRMSLGVRLGDGSRKAARK